MRLREHQLTHTSGIRSYTGMPSYSANMRRDLSVSELVASFRDQPMDFAPGARWSYNTSCVGEYELAPGVTVTIRV